MFALKEIAKTEEGLRDGVPGAVSRLLTYSLLAVTGRGE